MAQLSYIPAAKLVDFLVKADVQKNMQVRVLMTNQLALGIDPLNPTVIIDLSKEMVRPYAPIDREKSANAMAMEEQQPTREPRNSRQSGRYMLEMLGRTIESGSLKGLLAEGLRES